MFEVKAERVEVSGQAVEVRAMSTGQVLGYRGKVQSAGTDKAAQAACLGWLVAECVYDSAGVRVFDNSDQALAADCAAFDALLSHVMRVNGISTANPSKAGRARK